MGYQKITDQGQPCGRSTFRFGSMLSINVFRGASEQHCFKIGVRRATLIQETRHLDSIVARALLFADFIDSIGQTRSYRSCPLYGSFTPESGSRSEPTACRSGSDITDRTSRVIRLPAGLRPRHTPRRRDAVHAPQAR